MVGVYMNLILLLSITAVALNGVQPSPLISPACARLREQHRGARNTSQLFQKPALNKEYPLAFLHIPKNAGSSVFRVYGRLRIRDDEFHNEVYPDCNNRHVPPRYWQPHNPFDGNKVFCIIRDPVDKAISEFKMRNAGSLNEPGVVSKLQRWLLKKRDWEKGGTDCHMVPQHLYVWDDTGNTTCHHLIRYEDENLVQDYNAIVDAFPLMNKKKRMKPATESAKYRFHNYHHEALQYPLTARNLSTEVLKSVQQYYWKDMCLFGYDTVIEPQ